MTDTPTDTKAATGPTVSDFGIDTTSRSTMEAIGDYFGRVRGGQLGALPALLGLLVLVIVFTTLSGNFFTLNNIGNLFAQGAGQTIIAMGIVPVLLLGEIDLSAGTASGVAAGVLALHLKQHGNLLGAMGPVVFYGFVIGALGAVALCALLRIWAGAALSGVAVVILLAGFPANPWVEIILAICVGTVIGSLTGALVSKIRIPAFVVTLALFIGWYGLLLALVGKDGTVPVGSSPVLFEVANGNLSTFGSWVMFGILGGGYAVVVLYRHFARLRNGLVAQPTALVAFKAGAVVVLGGVATALFTLNRANNPNSVIKGVPYVVPIILVLLVAGTFMLDRTQYGRHVYAVGGNAEAARRAGVKVDKIRMSVFVICSSVAALGAIVYTSKVGAVDGNSGGGNTLLFAVGAAVIGGTSLFGGRGRLRDAVIGGLVLATVQNGLGLLGYQAEIVNMVTCLVLLFAATVDALSRRRASVTG